MTGMKTEGFFLVEHYHIVKKYHVLTDMKLDELDIIF